MRKLQTWSLTLLMSAAISAPLALSGCYGHVRYYDSTYGEYHPWNHHETVLYGRWEHDTHRQHMAFKERSQSDQNEYWQWRHGQH
jgi:hypothetical protein